MLETVIPLTPLYYYFEDFPCFTYFKC